MRFSVIIPTYRRPEILRRCLDALAKQNYPQDDFEVLVVDDGSLDEPGEDHSAEVVKSFYKTNEFSLKYLRQKHQGQGVARNNGIKQAKGEIVIFLGDDIFVNPDFLHEHDQAHLEHRRENEAVLGLVEWHSELTVTPLMQFMTTGGAVLGKFGGHQFAYDLLEGKTKADYRFFYTANISLKRTLVLEHHFDPWFSGYGWEDIELGYRLHKRTHMQLYYHPKAVGYHYHPMNEQGFAKRMRDIGASSNMFHEKYPELNKVPTPAKRLALGALSSHLSLRLLKHMHPFWYYYALSKKYYLEGLKQKVRQ